MNSQKLIAQIIGFGFSLFLANTVLADDIEVYGVYAGAEASPNVLFIIDISGSMGEGTDGSLPPALGEKSKKQILNEVFSEVITDSAGKINAGLILFNDETTGIKWPISNLTTLASSIDSNLPADMTNKDVLDSLVSNSGEWDATNYISPLTEAAQYFSGDKVWLNGWTWQGSFIPPVWESANNRYSNNWPEFWTPIPATYMPQDAFKPGNSGPTPATESCFDGYINDPSSTSYCTGKELVPNSCIVYPESTYTVNNCSIPEVCSDWGEGGSCNAWTCPGTFIPTTVTTPAYQYCDIYIGSWVAPNYVSPIGSSCQENYIILLSDGLPTVNDNPSKALEILGLPDINSCDNMGTMFFGDSSNNYGNCAAELVEHMASTDMVPGLSPSTVKTYTIGFGLTGTSAIQGSNYLTHLATKGGGEFFAATSYDGLVTSLNAIIDSISGEADDFGGISVGVRNTSFSNDNRAFLNIFKPSAKRSWSGNMKGYFLSSDGLLDLSGDPVLDSDGSIKGGVQSFWSKSPDGSFVTKGGLSETIKSGSRNLYTYTGSNSPSNINLNSSGAEHVLETSNLLLTNTMLGVVDDTNRTEVLDWVETAPMSDPLHTKPVIAKYPTGEVVFTMTNQGFIHAVDAEKPRVLNDESGGDELFAFIPPELLPNLQQIKTNLSTGQHIYGLDGQITFHHSDDNKDGVINSGETARLYFGMRRGGNNYYALDISDKTSPILLWQIKGGEGQFSEMGQSWSRMVLTTLKSSGSTKDVLIFGGGYDESEDAKTSRSAGKGNRVFIVDTSTGEHLWSVGSGASGLNAGEMIYSIPTDITTIDINGNGYTDHLYFGDLGGQLWRVTFEETLDGNGLPTNNFTSNASVKRIGDFGSLANRKFFYPPAVALMSTQGKNYLAITIGSGNRAHPLDETVQDMIFMVRDPLETPVMSALQLSDLYDATANLVGQGSDKAAERALMNAADGWYMKLGASEKSLSKMVVYDRKLRFTTYQPTAVVTQACSASSSSKGRYYVMKLGDATPSSDQVVDESELTKENRATEISVQGIASEPNIIFPPDGSSVEVFVGKENVSTVIQDVKQLYWKKLH